MANWKYIKLGVASLAIVAVALGIGIGVSKNKANSSASSSSKAAEATAFQIDCGERRNLVVPGTEDYQPTAPSARRKLMRRKLIRRLGTESEISDLLESSRTVDTATSSKSSKSKGATSKASKSEGPTSTKSSKSIEGCIPPSYVDKCTSKSGKSSSSTDGSRRELLQDISRELGKEAIPPPSIEEGRPIVSTTSSDGEIIISSKTSKATKSSKSQAPTTCASSKSSKSSSSSPSPRPSGGTDIIDTLTPTIFDTSTPTIPLIPASSNVPTPASVIPTPFPTSGGSQEGTPPFLSTTTESPTSDSPTPNPSEPPSPFPTPNPVTPAPVTPFPTTPAPVTPAPVTPAPTTPAPVTPAPTTPAPVTPAPTTPEPTTSNPTSFPTPELPTPSPSSGATPTVSTDITGPPTVPGREGWP